MTSSLSLSLARVALWSGIPTARLCHCARSPQGVEESCKERNQYVIPRIFILLDASLYFNTHPRAMRAWISAGVEVNRPRLDGYSHGMPQRVGSLFCFGR